MWNVKLKNRTFVIEDQRAMVVILSVERLRDAFGLATAEGQAYEKSRALIITEFGHPKRKRKK